MVRVDRGPQGLTRQPGGLQGRRLDPLVNVAVHEDGAPAREARAAGGGPEVVEGTGRLQPCGGRAEWRRHGGSPGASPTDPPSIVTAWPAACATGPTDSRSCPRAPV